MTVPGYSIVYIGIKQVVEGCKYSKFIPLKLVFFLYAYILLFEFYWNEFCILFVYVCTTLFVLIFFFFKVY